MYRIVIILGILMSSAHIYADDYIIVPGENPVTLPGEYPFSRIDSVLALLEPGDTLFFRQGEYKVVSSLRPVKSGTAEKPIVITVFPGERAVFNGAGLTTGGNNGRPVPRGRTGIITLSGVSHIKLTGLEVINSHNIGIAVTDTTTTWIELNGCKSHGSYNSGIGLWYCRNVKVLNCEVTGANDQEYRTVQPLRHEGPHEAVTVAGARYFEIAYNQVHDCAKEGIDCKEVSAHGVIHHNFVHDLPRQGIYADSWFGLLEDVEIRSNVVFGCEWGIAISSEGRDSHMRNIRIHHNLIFENRASGIFFGVWGNNEHREDILVYNNTVLRNGSPAHWAGKTGGIDIRSENLTHVRVFNNICSGNWAFEIATFSPAGEVAATLQSKDIVISNNLIEKHPDVDEEPGEFNQVWSWNGIAPVYGVPAFTDAPHFDFSLRKHSPAWKGYITPPGTQASDFIGAMGRKNEFDPFL